MAKKTLVAYLCWLLGGWFGLHHFYLERDRQAFVWWCLFAGYGGIGWFGDMFRIPRYVSEANEDPSYFVKLTEKMRSNPKPPFSLYRFGGQIMFGNLLAWVVYRAVPDEEVFGFSLSWLHVLIPLGSAIGAHTVGNIGREKGPLKPAIIGAYLPYLAYTYDNPRYYISSFLASMAFRRHVEWNREPKQKKHFCKRLMTLGLCALLYSSLWASFLYFNMEINNEHGEKIKFRDSVYNLLKSPMWKELTDTVSKLWIFYRVHGWTPLWNELMGELDPFGERNALRVLELPSSATQEEITQRWRQLSRKYHPDKFRDPDEKAAATEKFMEIKEAYDKISVINSKRKRQSTRSPRG